MCGENCGGRGVFTRRLLGSPSVMVPFQTKAKGAALEDQETRASVRQTHATSKITMRSCDRTATRALWTDMRHADTEVRKGGLHYQELAVSTTKK